MIFTDSHCHLDFPEFSEQLPQLLSACADNNIQQIIIPSIGPKNWQQVLTLAAQHQTASSCRLFACLGIHPWFLNDLNEQSLADLTTLAVNHQAQIIAIGETGIDGTIAEQQAEPKKHLAKQISFFEHQLNLANQLDLPVIVHHRKSHQQLVPILKKHALSRAGIIHAFSGSYQQAKAYLDLGYKLGIGGTITYPRAIKTIKTVQKLPLTSLVLETDAPAMPLAGFQGQVNSPLRIIDVFNQLVSLRTESPAAIAQQLELNVADVFSASKL
ncbi:MAG: TatD family hydrolase [Thalassotalea sp.]